jgi:hypothetical protein
VLYSFLLSISVSPSCLSRCLYFPVLLSPTSRLSLTVRLVSGAFHLICASIPSLELILQLLPRHSFRQHFVFSAAKRERAAQAYRGALQQARAQPLPVSSSSIRQHTSAYVSGFDLPAIAKASTAETRMV